MTHSAAVIQHADQALAAGLHRNLDAHGAGIERVLNQFLDHRSRALDDLACGDLVGHSFREDVDRTHWFSQALSPELIPGSHVHQARDLECRFRNHPGARNSSPGGRSPNPGGRSFSSDIPALSRWALAPEGVSRRAWHYI